MFYFIADPHFGHQNVLKLCNRPFETISLIIDEVFKIPFFIALVKENMENFVFIVSG